jgi:hypothetical protein
MAKRKMRKFSDGGFSSAQEEWLGGADRTDPYILARMRSAVPDSPEKSPMGDDSPAGKTGYGEQNDLPETETATRVTAARTPAKPVARPAAKPTAPTMPDEEKARMESLVKKQALERVSPETALIGGGGLKLLQTAGRNLASKIAKNRGLNDYVVPKLTGPSASSKTPALPSPTPRLPYDKAGAMSKKRADRAEARDEDMRRENAERYGITDFSAPGFGALRDRMMKKGGAVSKADMQKAGFYDKDKTKSERQKIVSKVTTKPQRVAIVEKAFSTKNMKSGGSVSSASKRADGCAIRGKTRA